MVRLRYAMRKRTTRGKILYWSLQGVLGTLLLGTVLLASGKVEACTAFLPCPGGPNKELIGEGQFCNCPGEQPSINSSTMPGGWQSTGESKEIPGPTQCCVVEWFGAISRSFGSADIPYGSCGYLKKYQEVLGNPPRPSPDANGDCEIEVHNFNVLTKTITNVSPCPDENGGPG